jgi:cell division septum initiation protein DivIVA
MDRVRKDVPQLWCLNALRCQTLLKVGTDAKALFGALSNLKQVEAREAAAETAIAKADRAKADADRVRNELQTKIDLLRNRVREIAAA